MKFRRCILLFLLLLFYRSARSTTWITIDNGNWNDSSVWLSGIVPSYSNADTILIKDTVYFDGDINLNSGALLQIDSGGGLCGHYNITVYSGAIINKYGALDLDTLFVVGGIGNFIGPGFLMWYISGHGGGSMYFNAVGLMTTWDTCFIPTPVVIPPENPVIKNEYSIYPNPSSGYFNLKYFQENESIFNFYNVLGQKLFSKKLFGTSDIVNFVENNLNNGMYYWEVVSDDKICQNGKQLIIK